MPYADQNRHFFVTTVELGLEFGTQREIPERAGEAGAVEAPRYINAQGKSKEEKPPANASSDEQILILHPVRCGLECSP